MADDAEELSGTGVAVAGIARPPAPVIGEQEGEVAAGVADRRMPRVMPACLAPAMMEWALQQPRDECLRLLSPRLAAELDGNDGEGSMDS